MRFLSLFSGIEAASVAWKPLGWECVAVAEMDRFASAVLNHHYPDVPNLGDVTRITQEQIESLGHIDVVVFGFPCQDLSVAGKRKGLKNADGTDTRSGLFFTAEKITRWAKARWSLAENVPGLFSSNEGWDFAAVVGELAGAEMDIPRGGWQSSGVALGPRGLVEWVVLDAQYFGLAQRRKRVFIIRDSGGQWENRPPLFLIPESLRGDPAPSRETWKGIAPTISSRTKGGGGLGTDAECDGAVIPIQEIGRRQTGTPMNGVGHGQPGDPMFTLQSAAVHGVAHALKGEGFDGSEDGTGRGTPIVPDVAWALQERDSKGSDSSTKEGHLIPVEKQVHTLAIRGRDGQQQLEVRDDGTANAILTPNGGRGGIGVGAVAIHENQRGEITTNDTAGSLKVSGGKPGQGYPAAIQNAAVRRLTPSECAVLQGFPRDYCMIPWRGQPAKNCPDGPQYKAYGNSMAVPCMKWLGERIQLVNNLAKVSDADQSGNPDE